MRWMAPIEFLYQGVNAARRALYRNEFLKSQRVPRPVISIGNLSIGGAGKTPLTIAVARHLTNQGRRVAILSRGYGRTNEREYAIVDSADVARFGDEPVLLRSALPGVDVVVGADRSGAAGWYLANHDCDLFLLDDGFQHLQLARDVDIVIDDRSSGYAREGRSALRDADLILTRDDGEAASGANRIGIRPVAVIELDRVLPLEVLRGARVLAFSALAHNDRFFRQLEQLGAIVVARYEFRDHHRYTSEDLATIRAGAAAGNVDRVITTEKDLVKVRYDSVSALRVEMHVEPAILETVDRMLEKLK